MPIPSRPLIFLCLAFNKIGTNPIAGNKITKLKKIWVILIKNFKFSVFWLETKKKEYKERNKEKKKKERKKERKMKERKKKNERKYKRNEGTI